MGWFIITLGQIVERGALLVIGLDRIAEPLEGITLDVGNLGPVIGTPS